MPTNHRHGLRLPGSFETTTNSDAHSDASSSTNAPQPKSSERPCSKRPVVANTVIALLETPTRVCNAAPLRQQRLLRPRSRVLYEDIVGSAGVAWAGPPCRVGV